MTTTRILLADDHEVVREGIKAIIAREADLQIVGEAATSEEALREAARLTPDIVIMDVAFRDISGVDATRLVKTAHPQTHVIALSAHSDKRYVTAMLQAGAMAYVLKSGMAHELVEAIAALRDGRIYLSKEIAVASGDDASHAARDLLGDREREVLQLLADGHSSPQIAQRLSISVKTVETHRHNIMTKLGIHTIAMLTKYAVREGLTSLNA